MQEPISDAVLERLSVRELTDLQADIHTAIRAAIRRINDAKLNPGAHRFGDSRPAGGPAEPAKRSLAEERDAWLAKRKA